MSELCANKQPNKFKKATALSPTLSPTLSHAVYVFKVLFVWSLVVSWLVGSLVGNMPAAYYPATDLVQMIMHRNVYNFFYALSRLFEL